MASPAAARTLYGDGSRNALKVSGYSSISARQALLPKALWFLSKAF
jgi:hypothetical protein